MTTDATGFKDAVREQWTHAAGVWGKWHPKFSEMSREATQHLCDAADLKAGQSVLDLAGGTGEPSLSVAARVAPAGDVTCTDFVPEMVAVAQANAADANVANIKFQQVDAESIPFPDASFDRVVSRFGVMFFPDTQKALGEIRRVLKPGARATFAMWQTTAKNPWFEEINAVVARSGHFTPPPPGMPTPFRFGEAGSLPSELRSAGFEHVSEKPHEISWSWPGSPEEYLEFVEGTMPAFRKALESSGADAKRVKEDMLGVVAQHYDGERVSVPGNIFVVTAQKPG